MKGRWHAHFVITARTWTDICASFVAPTTTFDARCYLLVSPTSIVVVLKTQLRQPGIFIWKRKVETKDFNAVRVWAAKPILERQTRHWHDSILYSGRTPFQIDWVFLSSPRIISAGPWWSSWHVNPTIEVTKEKQTAIEPKKACILSVFLHWAF